MGKNQKPVSLLQGMPWTPSDETDVQARWRKCGWKPKAEAAAKPAPKPIVQLIGVKRR